MINKFQKNMRWKLTDHFDVFEFQCHCAYPECDITYVDSDLVDYLEKKRADLGGVPIKIMSGFRCTRHNNAVGGKAGSSHLTGKAADIQVKGVLPSKVQDICEDADGLGRYKTFTHVDVRYGLTGNKKSRWEG